MGWISNPNATNVKGTIAFGGMFNLWHVDGHHWHSSMGGGFIPQSAWAWFEKDDNLVEIIWTSKIAYAKPFKITWGVLNWTSKFNKCNWTKKMDAISKYHGSNLFMDGMFVYLNYFFLLTLFTFIN